MDFKDGRPPGQGRIHRDKHGRPRYLTIEIADGVTELVRLDGPQPIARGDFRCPHCFGRFVLTTYEDDKVVLETLGRVVDDEASS
jgi:hypothetical protein